MTNITNAKDLVNRAKAYFDLKADKKDENEIIERINSDIHFRGANLWILIFAILIASLGLNVNSTAVIIGAMLISPLMGPIIGMGLAVGLNDLELLKHAAKNYGVATLISVLTATVYFIISPLGDAQSELLARTSPTIYDVLIAFCGGAAGIIAICSGGKGNVIPGVAIATALMPPLCTAGFGLATGHILYFLGAFYLFFINTVFITLATYGGVRLMHFKKRNVLAKEQDIKTLRIIVAIIIATMIPAIIMTISIVRKSVFDNNVKSFIQTELAQRGTQIISSSVEKDSLMIRVVAVGREIDESTISFAEKHLDQYGMKGFRLRIIQNEMSDSILAINNRLSYFNTVNETERKHLIELSNLTADLSEQLEEYKKYDILSSEIKPELKVLFPNVRNLSLGRIAESTLESDEFTYCAVAIVNTVANNRLSVNEKERLHDWLKARISVDSLILIEK